MGAVPSQFDKLPSCYPSRHENHYGSDANGDTEVDRPPEDTSIEQSNPEDANSSVLHKLNPNEHNSGFSMYSAFHHLPERSIAKFHTLRKKMSKLRRRATYNDYRKQFREFVSSWNYGQVLNLKQEYEALGVLKDMSRLATLARPNPATIKIDMGRLFDHAWCTDVQVSYQGVTFEVHRSILSARCAFFQSRFQHWLAKPDVTNNSSSGNSMVSNPSPMPIELDICVDVRTFTTLLRYLYTGSICLEDTGLDKWDTLNALCDRFGLPNPLEEDMTLLQTASPSDCDCVLVFSKSPDVMQATLPKPQCNSSPSSSEDKQSNQQHHSHNRSHHRHHHRHHHHDKDKDSSRPQCRHTDSQRHSRQPSPYEVHCHRAVLVARSKFFRNIILRRSASLPGSDSASNSSSSHSGNPIRIVLDESIIPRRFAQALVGCLYTDRLDLRILGEASRSKNHTHPGHGVSVPAECAACLADIMELYQIGQFLEFPMMCHVCEEVLVEALSVENLVSVLRWSGEPHGSVFVHRQALHFLQEEFLSVAHSPLLATLSRRDLTEVISSSWLQAPESEVLSAVIRWGENTLMRSMEEREAGPTSNGSASKKSIRRKDMNDSELAEVIADLIPLVRMEHILPSSNDVVQAAIKRGLIQHPPTIHKTGSSQQVEDRIAYWCRSASNQGSASIGKSGGLERSISFCVSSDPFVPLRLFTPFYDEVKAVLLEQSKSGGKVCPETGAALSPHLQYRKALDLIPAHATHLSASAVGVLDRRVVKLVRERVRELQQLVLVQRALTTPRLDRASVLTQLRLRALREAGLPDTTLTGLFTSHFEHHHPPPTTPPPPPPVMTSSTPVPLPLHVSSSSSRNHGKLCRATNGQVWQYPLSTHAHAHGPPIPSSHVRHSSRCRRLTTSNSFSGDAAGQRAAASFDLNRTCPIGQPPDVTQCSTETKNVPIPPQINQIPTCSCLTDEVGHHHRHSHLHDYHHEASLFV